MADPENRLGTLERVYRANYPALLTYVQKLTLGDIAKAEDVVQEAMVRAWKHMNRYRLTPETARPWLFAVAKRIVIDQLRAKAARPIEMSGDWMEFRPATDNEIDRALDALDARHALASLPAHHRDVLVNLYLRERTTEETAAAMGIPPGTVKSRAHHALRTARRVMNRAGQDRNQASSRCSPATSSVEAENPA
ncbi:sigma-70 family RNA polymerase sigma factor [Micromonospora echinofusca]|uniref:RNA polymerase sigma factor n=1 Tax=Micromonospora echinofusca TaxID=47858 RepID=A0ABS3VUK7_MICEH|nr:sigma-70 family RNA polymerase sigma factor [Micromonospora echinofusca]MBO4208212.1 sigma-70 family RNA polymerase sigma factor [Micromonospora echinofusca]